MGLFDDFAYRNDVPNQHEEWTTEQALTAWTLFLDGHSYRHIGTRVGKNSEAVRNRVKGMILHYPAYFVFATPDRSERPWTARDQWAVDLGSKHGLSDRTLALLLGRSTRTIKGKRK